MQIFLDLWDRASASCAGICIMPSKRNNFCALLEMSMSGPRMHATTSSGFYLSKICMHATLPPKNWSYFMLRAKARPKHQMKARKVPISAFCGVVLCVAYLSLQTSAEARRQLLQTAPLNTASSRPCPPFKSNISSCPQCSIDGGIGASKKRYCSLLFHQNVLISMLLCSNLRAALQHILERMPDLQSACCKLGQSREHKLCHSRPD